MLRMMAKRPEDRFASFEELIEALDRVPLRDEAESPGIALVPLDPPDSYGLRSPRGAAGSPRRSWTVRNPARRHRSPRSRWQTYPQTCVRTIPQHFRACGRAESLQRASCPGWERMDSHCQRGQARLRPSRAHDPHQSSLSASAWIALCVAIGASFVFMVIMIDRFVRSSPPTSISPPIALAPSIDAGVSRDSERALERDHRSGFSAQFPLQSPPERSRPHPVPPVDVKPVEQPVAVAVEPVDIDPPAPVSAAYTEETLRKYLPEWALAPVPARVEGPLIQVRRVARSREPTLFPSLRVALNETKGTIEIADEGPFLINDFRVPGESRLIRARPGFHPIIRIDRPNLEAVWSLPGVIVLEGKSLVLDSLDMIVNLRDLNAAQTSLFCCTGANLTVRNCTITLVNPANQPFTLVRAEGTATRGSRIRFEKTLIRGAVSSGFDLGKGSVDVAVRETIFLGSQGPLVRGLDPERRGDQRFSVVGGVLASRGPGFRAEGGGRWRCAAEADSAGHTSVRYGFWPVPGGRDRQHHLLRKVQLPARVTGLTGSVSRICSVAGRDIMPAAPEQTLRVPSLAAFRSTWNGTDQNSREILAAWPQPQHLGQAVPADLRPFVPGREPALVQAAAPRPFLGAKTLWTFPPPAVPVPVGLTAKRQPRRPRSRPRPHSIRTPEPRRKESGPRSLESHRGRSRTRECRMLDLVFDTDSAQWHGDLGAFLREKMTDEVKHARVRVRGSGPRRSSPVRLRDGLVLEIRVEPPVNRDSEWLSWQPEAESRGRALFELHGGTLLLVATSGFEPTRARQSTR